MTNDHYKTLGIDKNASEKEVKAAYRKLARKYHPDVNFGDNSSEEKFKEINKAYQVLSDINNRQKYDQYGENWNAGSGFNNSNFSEAFTTKHSQQNGFSFFNESFDLSELLKNMSGTSFKNNSQQNFYKKKKKKQSNNITTQILNITLEDAYHGASKELIFYLDKAPCNTCKGIKRLAGAICHNCRGSGFEKSGRKIEVNVPKGIIHGQKIRLKNVVKETSGFNKQDLIIIVEVENHPIFYLNKNNLHYKAKVDVSDCVLGAEITIPRINGKQVKLIVPPKTISGQIFKLAGQGMPKSTGYGDLFVEIDVQIPEKMTEEHIDLFNQMKNLDDKVH
ncbi:MAG: molecular chaperone DnaJ [Chloroflexi bacterium]|jgi:molecular chaperone DnaJ|nr:MAG: molecular chaperone DnaJ [Chloroflexota bacterium]|tara:strand:- start:1439 stop:2443 length:1005 start_codon:yes stop_codon:yes gene_type:complete